MFSVWRGAVVTEKFPFVPGGRLFGKAGSPKAHTEKETTEKPAPFVSEHLKARRKAFIRFFVVVECEGHVLLYYTVCLYGAFCSFL